MEMSEKTIRELEIGIKTVRDQVRTGGVAYMECERLLALLPDGMKELKEKATKMHSLLKEAREAHGSRCGCHYCSEFDELFPGEVTSG